MANELAGSSSRVVATEKRVLLGATVFIAVSLGLIAYATWGLGITVPTCLPPSKGFEQASITKHQGKNYEVHFVARMWGFEPTRVRVPTGSTLDIYVMSKDVQHGFQIAGTNINLMVVPGAIVNGSVHFDKPGNYLIVCHEYCGAAHQNMNAAIEVSDHVADISAEGLPETASAGKKILEDKGCLACHSLDGNAGIGPTLKGIWGKSVELTDGSRHALNEEFLREIILHPEKNVVKGYQPLMPALPLSDEEIKQIEEYLRELK
jgi:cytochrome c oxidase subunit 2